MKWGEGREREEKIRFTEIRWKVFRSETSPTVHSDAWWPGELN